MSDDVVDEVAENFYALGQANGIDDNALHPIIASVVNRLRKSGISDEHIIEALGSDE